MIKRTPIDELFFTIAKWIGRPAIFVENLYVEISDHRKDTTNWKKNDSIMLWNRNPLLNIPKNLSSLKTMKKFEEKFDSLLCLIQGIIKKKDAMLSYE